MIKEPKVSVIIPTVDRADALYRLLKYLENQSYSNYEIIIVEQSKEIDKRIVSYVSAKQHIKLVHLTKRGLPNARNEGIRNASGDIVLFTDDDEVPDKDLILYHAKQYEKEWVSGVGGRVSGGYDNAPDGNNVGSIIEWSGKVIRNFNSDTEKEVKHLPGGNMSFRRGLFDRVGFFDDSYRGTSIGEETDFCLRAAKAGYRFIFEPMAFVEHLHLQSGGCRDETVDEWLYWCLHNSTLLYMRYMKMPAVVVLFMQHFFRIIFFAGANRSPNLILIGLRGVIDGTKTYRLSHYSHNVHNL